MIYESVAKLRTNIYIYYILFMHVTVSRTIVTSIHRSTNQEIANTPINGIEQMHIHFKIVLAIYTNTHE